MAALARPQASGATSRPKIALALSGGGAYGFAELGALEWLEEHRIPVDGIAGTSGGALVGGWYATGLELLNDEELAHPPPHRSVDDMRLRGVTEVLRNVDVPSMFQSLPDYRDLWTEAKADARNFPSGPLLGFSKSGLHFSNGFIPGQKVGLFLDRITLRYPVDYLYQGSTAPFDNLPTPFRAVAVDVHGFDYRNWEQVVLGGAPLPKAPGYRVSLAQAMRASMAIPVVFTPVYIPDLRTASDQAPYELFDGGVRDNFPTDVAIDEFHPDVVIGLGFLVDLSLLSRVLTLTGHPSIPVSMEKESNAFKPGSNPSMQPSIALKVPLDTGIYWPYQFERWRELAWQGYRSMERFSHSAKGKQLLQLSLPLPEYMKYRLARRSRRSTVNPIVRGVTVKPPLPEVTPPRSLQQLHGRLSDPNVRNVLEAAASRMAAKTVADTVDYELAGTEDGSEVLLRPQIRPFGPPYLDLGAEAGIQSGDRLWGQFKTEFLSPHFMPDLDFRANLSVGSQLFAGASFDWRPLGDGLFLQPVVSFTREPQFSFAGNHRSSEADLDHTSAGLAVGFRGNRFSETRLSATVDRISPDSVRGESPEIASGSYRSLNLRYSFDNSNEAILPTSGYRVDANLKQLYEFPGGPPTLTQASLFGEVFQSTSRHDNPLFFRAGLGTSFGAHAPFATQFTLGGFNLMNGYRIDELRGDGYLYGSAGYLQKIYQLPFYFGDVYMGGWVEAAQLREQTALDATIGVYLDSRLGPLFIGGSFAEHGSPRLLVTLGISPWDHKR
ncbi:MAG TPA: patatin-like phospholipase family protein [Fimbriimonas sp.]|nr:patatin-like phospholipase family protein [Fimbriimonas sp.]